MKVRYAYTNKKDPDRAVDKDSVVYQTLFIEYKESDYTNYTTKTKRRQPMSKMGQELDRKLDEAKYDLYEACKALLAERINIGVDKPFWTPGNKERLEQAIAKVEG